ncbi:MAG TPA: ABC transporter permease subunit [Clostridia bacterium]|nr:ABC transporter permease subunit [Clostridia bacterium]
MHAAQTRPQGPRGLRLFVRRAIREKYLMLLLIPGLVYYLLFHYMPMYGVVIAFQNYKLSSSIGNAPWVGLRWFGEFFRSFYFGRLMRNTLLISLYNLVFGFPIPIVFALILHEMRGSLYKRVVQTISYLPHFISTVVVVGMLQTMLSTTDGVINNLLRASGHNAVSFFTEPRWFRTLYIGSGIWESFGWSSIIYLAALSNADPELYEAARIDGANRWHLVLHVSLPCILPTVIILLIMQLGRTMSVGYEKIILMYTPSTYEVADVISTYVYRRGIEGGQFSFGAAVGLFNSPGGQYLQPPPERHQSMVRRASE